MKKYFIFAASALALAGCSSDDYLGGENPGNENGTSNAINFAGATGNITRADKVKGGATAADLLGENFYVLGTKGTLPKTSPTTTKVFNNYQVAWTANTAGTTDDNTNDWKYVGLDFTNFNTDTRTETDKQQSIKYWDYSQPQYDFIAYSTGKSKLITEGTPTGNQVLGTEIKTPTTTAATSYSLTAATVDALKNCYYTDVTTVKKANYGSPVTFTFKNLTAKIRVAFYETIPGYSVKDLKFYTSEGENVADNIAESNAYLYTTGTDKLETSGKIDVTYPVVGSDLQSDVAFNKALVNVTAGEGGTTTNINLGKVNYTNEKLAITAKEATIAGTNDNNNNYYTSVLPSVTTGKALTLRMNYTLVSEDGSNEEIHVYGATAVIPAAYTQWQPNYAYTYIFKISDNTNGSTSTDTDKKGLFPITFDAVVANDENVDFEHESITTVATPSVTSYAFNNTDKKVIKAYKNGNEYPAATSTDIYFSVEGKKGLDVNGKLYKVTNATTEAQVINALQVRTSGEDNLPDNVVGRNNVKLEKEDTDCNITEIPTEDNKKITVTEKTVAKFGSASVAGTYAYVYYAGEDTQAAKEYITAVSGDDTTTAGENEYFTDYKCTEKVATGTILATGTTYYKKYVNNGKKYGVKVVTLFTGN